MVLPRDGARRWKFDGNSHGQTAQPTSATAPRQYLRRQSLPRRPPGPWRHSPEGEQFAGFSDALCDVMENVQLDARKRQFIWPDGERLDLDQSVARIHQHYPDFRRDWIEEYLIDWMEMDYAPEHYSTAQLDELDTLTARWTADILRNRNTAKRQNRTRHS